MEHYRILFGWRGLQPGDEQAPGLVELQELLEASSSSELQTTVDRVQVDAKRAVGDCEGALVVEVSAPDGGAAESFADALTRKVNERLPALSGFVGTTTAEVARIEHVAAPD